MKINVNIERLILDDLPLPQAQRPRLQQAVEAELARLLTDNALPAHLSASGAVPVLPASSLQWSSPADPQQLGQQIAQSVYASFGANSE